nr:hypothetical protein GCM10020092_088920 [Actinoplanes digitatis]
MRALSRAHPGAYPLLLNRPSAGASASWLTAALRGCLHDAGVPADQVPRQTRMICAFLLGYTVGEVTGGLPVDDAAGHGDAAAEFDADLDDLVRLVEVTVGVG